MSVRIADVGGIFLLALLWSPTFLAIRVGVEVLPPITLTCIRVASGGLLLMLITLFLKKPVVLRKAWKETTISALLINALPFLFCSLGEVTIDSSTTSIIEGGVPLFILLISYFFLGQRNIEKRKVVGILIGFFGLCLIFGPTIHIGGKGAALGIFYLFLMTLFFAIGFLYSERKLKDLPPVRTAGIQMVLATFMLLPAAALFESPWKDAMPPLKILGFVAIFGAFGSALGWVVYYKMLARLSAATISLATLLVPIFSILWGVLFLHEPLHWYKITGAIVTLLSIAMVTDLLPSHT